MRIGSLGCACACVRVRGSHSLSGVKQFVQKVALKDRLQGTCVMRDRTREQWGQTVDVYASLISNDCGDVEMFEGDTDMPKTWTKTKDQNHEAHNTQHHHTLSQIRTSASRNFAVGHDTPEMPVHCPSPYARITSTSSTQAPLLAA